MKQKLTSILIIITILICTTIYTTNPKGELPKVELKVAEQVQPEIRTPNIFKITHYCPCMKCCGKTNGITATGTIATSNKTIAVDPDVITLGSIVEIDGIEYVAEDVGGGIGGKRIDIFVSTHQEALNRGVINRDVIIK